MRPDDPEERAELDRWCRAVGSPVVYRPAGAGRAPARVASFGPPPPADPARPAPAYPAPSSLALVAWNVNVGRGHLDLLIEDLRAGRLTGEPATHFVLLLQEVFRAGAAVPSGPDAGSRSADRIGSDEDRSAPGDIVRFARERGLHLFYAPSMRNGRDDPEDRGNAILSTLPLSDLEVVELPVQRQRRAAVAATVEGVTPGLRVVSVHLDHFSGWDRMHRSLGQDRERHARRLVAAFGDEESIAIGGDFNTWLGGNGEPAVRLMRTHFPDPVERPTEGTLEAAFFPFNRLLDHLFFRVPEGWEADYRVAPSRYGSDHRPLVGTIRIPRPDLTEWGRTLGMRGEASRQMEHYVAGGAPLGADYRSGLADRLRGEIFESADERVRAFGQGRCEPSIDVTFGSEALVRDEAEAAPPSRTRSEARFEEGLVRVEVVACLPDVAADPVRALDVYTAPAFRREAEGRILDIHEEGGDTCVETDGIAGLLKPTLTCHRIHRFEEGSVAAEHSQLVRNPASGTRRGLQDIYFKESLKTFVALPEGGLAFHYVNVTRSGDLNRVERWVGSGQIREGEERKVELLRQRLGERGTPQ